MKSNFHKNQEFQDRNLLVEYVGKVNEETNLIDINNQYEFYKHLFTDGKLKIIVL